MNEVKAMAEVWKGRMDLLASEKETAKEELAYLRSVVVEWDTLGSEYEALKSKLDTTSADADKMMAQYKADMEAAETRLNTKAEYIKQLSRRDTLEEIHARGFDLSVEIEEAKRLKAEKKELYEPEGSKGSEGSEGSDGSDDESGPGKDQA
uniref:Uncharacterized protein n=1 Tax=Nicotiana tabacum TaxID=4097 RepID=A0A1S4AUQ4_TOBAC|nr:PREDICTED: uncharacterized protein LOC107801576 [Nicotiana tabacum]